MKLIACMLLVSLQLRLFAAEPAVADKATYLAELCQTLTLQWPRNRMVEIVVHGHSVPAGYFKTPSRGHLQCVPAPAAFRF